VTEPVSNADPPPPAAEPERAEPERAEPERAEPERAELIGGPQFARRRDAPPPPPWTHEGRRRLDGTDGWLLIAIAALSLLIHVARLGSPGAVLPDNTESCQKLPPVRGGACHALIPLDEVHYVPDARDVLTYGTDSDKRIQDGEGQSGRFVVHPPVGKWFIAAGIWLFGDRPFGWRFFGAVFGSLASVLAYMIARRLWAQRWAAVLAAGLLAVEGLWFVQSRVAMLDIYAATFLLLGAWLLLEDRDRGSGAPAGFRWWRIGGAAALGLALATKWVVLPFVAILIGMSFAWELVRVFAVTPRRTTRAIATFLATFLAVPLLVYIATYVPWALNEQRYSPGGCSTRATALGEQYCYHKQMVGFHRNLEKYEHVPAPEDDPDAVPTLKPKHPYFGQAWSWPWIGRPVAHHFETIGEEPTELASEVLGLPNPAIWIVGFLALLPLTFWTLRRGDPVAAFILGMVAAGWLPYLFADIIGRPVFLFYATPMVPFLVLGVVHLWVRISYALETPRALIAYAALVVAMFAYFYPVISAHPIPRKGATGWEAHMWLNGSISDCRVTDQIKTRCWI
jgi:dolichyl-phosphate-mannose--protein O-mannosyl transferase